MNTRVIFDTNAYSNLFRGQPDCIEVLRLSPRIAVPVVVMAELLSGFRNGNRYAQNLAKLEEFLALPRVDLIFPDQETAFVYSSINVALGQSGQIIPTNDIWIAAMAVQHQNPLFTFDTHFSRVQGLHFGLSAIQLGLRK
jgi:tRNA(fMet)-specific endonuclease VapC